MQSANEILNILPEDTQARLRELWASLAPEERQALQAVVRGMPN